MNGIDVALVAVGLLLLLLLERYLAWRDRINYRRLERRSDLNIGRATGRWT